MLKYIVGINDLYIVGMVMLVLLLAIFGKFVFNLINKGMISDIVENNSKTFSFRFGAFLFGIIFALSGEMIGISNGILQDMLSFLGYSVLMMVLFTIAVFIGDKIILRKLNNTDELREGNMAVAVFEALYIISTGIIARASLVGEGGGVVSVILFFILGQIMLILFFLVALAWTPFDDISEIKKGNVAAGLLLGGMLFSISIINYYSIIGDSTGMINDLFLYFISVIKGGILLLVFSTLLDKIVFPKIRLSKDAIVRDSNWGFVLVVVLVTTAMSITIGLNL